MNTSVGRMITMIQLYINRKDDISCWNVGNKERDTPLHYASYWGHYEPVELLLSTGLVDLNRKNGNGNSALDDAREGLMKLQQQQQQEYYHTSSLKKGHSDIVKLLENAMKIGIDDDDDDDEL